MVGSLCAGLAASQIPNPTSQSARSEDSIHHGPEPIYRVEVVQRSVEAVNYGHRTAATRVDLKGTVLAPEAHGEAKVESKRGAVEIEAKVEHLSPPTRFGNEYLTYVLWAITPEGRPTNLGELVLGPDNNGKLKVSSELQAFALIVTAEPYFAVTQPSDVVVMENLVRPDTVGKVEEVVAKYAAAAAWPLHLYEADRRSAVTTGGEKLSMDQMKPCSHCIRRSTRLRSPGPPAPTAKPPTP